MSQPPAPPGGEQPPASSSPPPDGEGPFAQLDFVYNASQADATMAFGAIMTTITTAAIVARLYTRCFVTRRLWIDDAWALGALLSTIGVYAMQCVFLKRYLPTMATMIEAGNDGSKIPYAAQIVYNFAMASLKMTFLFQFYQIFRHVRTMRYVYMAAIVVVAAWSITQICLGIFVCVPIEANWNHSITNATCMSSVWSTYFNATGTIVTDIIVLFLPLPTLWGLKLRGSQLWAAIGVFGIGAIVPIISGGRIWSLNNAPPKGYMSTACWTMAELGVGITAASLATIRHLLDRKLSSTLQSYQMQSRGQSAAGTFVSQAPTPSYNRATESEDDLIGGGWPLTKGGLANHQLPRCASLIGKEFEDAVREKFGGGPTGKQHTIRPSLTPARGRTKTNVTTTPGVSMSMSQGAATFLGEFGILVQKTWEVEETRMA